MFDVCGIGNACIDIVACVDDAFLARWNFPKSICSYLELAPANRLEAELPTPIASSRSAGPRPFSGGSRATRWATA
jgi:sugar/nucleoside kinase (ribokinase family)